MELTCTGFGDMLHDKERNQKYFAALRSTIARMHSDGREVHVLDIGTGTGILSMMALSAGADTVTACEAFMPMANCAERIFEANGFGDKVRLVKKRSTEMRIGEDMPRKANLLVAELLDTELIGEGAISIYNHAHNELLTDDVICIPAKANCYAQVVQSPLAAQWNTMKIIADLDGNILLKPSKDVLECKGDAAVHDVQLSQLGPEHFRALTKPMEIFEFDFNKKTNRSIRRRKILEVTALQPGSTDIVFYWWDIKMEPNDELTLSCAPYWAHPEKESNDVIPWRDHWMQAIYYIPKSLHVSGKGEKFVLNCNHDEYSLWFDVQKALNATESSVPRHACTCNLHLAYPRSRIGQLNQAVRNKRYLNYLEQNLSKESQLLCLGDGCVLGLAAAKMGVASVILCENHVFSKRFMESIVDSNKLENVHLLKNIYEIEEPKLKEITHIFAEPYFFTSILPWDNLQFGLLLHKILNKLPATVNISPHSAKIFAVPVQFTDLHKIRTPVGQCEGFDLRHFDRMIEQARKLLTDHQIEAQPLWEYPCKALAKPQELLNVVFRNFNEEKTGNGTIEIESAGSCNGIALWVEWNLDGASNPKSLISTGPVQPIIPGNFIKWDMFVRQGVQIFEKSYQVVNEKSNIQWRLLFKPTANKIHLHFDVKA
ncbi:protein arginine N-methyltransferase 7 isoform X2 [Ceratitis capitata]|nr:protein arginine N-methyltransferase 7 isoform X2 [Ceratitis capitata]